MDGRVVILAAVALLLSGCAHPGSVASASAAALTESAHVDDYAVPVAGTTAHGVLGVPATAPKTLVIIAHPFTSSAEAFRPAVQQLADTGVLAVAMDFRGDQQAYKLGNGTADTLAATFDLQARYPSVDRTLLYGWSMGGEIAFLAVASAPAGTYDYVFDGAGVTDLTSLWEAFPYARPFIEHETGGTPIDVPAQYDVRSPVLHVSDLIGKGVARYFIVHGAGDSPVPIDQAERLYSKMADAGLPVSYYVVTTDKDPYLCVPVVSVCGPNPSSGVANHEAGSLRLMGPLILHRIQRQPDPAAQALRGTYDGEAGTYEPSDVG